MTGARITALLACALAGCAPVAHPDFAPTPEPVQAAERTAEYTALVPLLMREVLARAPRVEPLMVDVQSLVAAARSLPPGRAVDRAAVGAAIGRDYLDVPTADAIVRHPGSRFEILHRGLHVSIDSIVAADSAYEAHAAYRYTDVRGESTAVGIAHLAVAFVRVGGTWQIRSTRVLGVS